MGLREPPGSLQEFARRHDEPHVTDHRLHHDGSDGVALGAERGFELAGLVVFQHDGVLCRAGCHSRGVRHAKRGCRRACSHEQGVGVPVVVPSEFDQLVTAGEAPRQPHRAHRGLRPRTHHPHLLDARHGIDDQFGQLALSLGWRPVAGTRLKRCFDRGHHPGVAMAENHRPP